MGLAVSLHAVAEKADTGVVVSLLPRFISGNSVDARYEQDASRVVYNVQYDAILSDQTQAHRPLSKVEGHDIGIVGMRFRPFQVLLHRKEALLSSSYQIGQIDYEWQPYTYAPFARGEVVYLCYSDPFWLIPTFEKNCVQLVTQRGSTERFKGFSTQGQLSILHILTLGQGATPLVQGGNVDKVKISYQRRAIAQPPDGNAVATYTAMRSGGFRVDDIDKVFSEQRVTHQQIVAPGETATTHLEPFQVTPIIFKGEPAPPDIGEEGRIQPSAFKIGRIVYAWQPYSDSTMAEETVELCYSKLSQLEQMECRVLTERAGTVHFFSGYSALGRISIRHTLNGKTIAYPVQSSKVDFVKIMYRRTRY